MFLLLSNGDDVNYKLIRSIMRNCRVNIANVSRETGLNYASIKNRLRRLCSKKVFDVKPLIAAKLAGSIGALVRFRVNNHAERIIDLLSKCNRVLGMIYIGDELIVMFHARDKMEILNMIDKLTMFGDGLKEFSIEYGKIPHNLMIPLKNPDPCIRDCFLVDGEEYTNCFPVLSLKNNHRVRNNRNFC